jgi:hypothetical protein
LSCSKHTLSWARWTQSTSCLPISLRSIFAILASMPRIFQASSSLQVSWLKLYMQLLSAFVKFLIYLSAKYFNVTKFEHCSVALLINETGLTTHRILKCHLKFMEV